MQAPNWAGWYCRYTQINWAGMRVRDSTASEAWQSSSCTRDIMGDSNKL